MGEIDNPKSVYARAMPQILQIASLHRWIDALTNGPDAPFPHGVSTAQMRDLADQEMRQEAISRGEPFKSYWRTKNHLHAALFKEVRAQRIRRVLPGFYVGTSKSKDMSDKDQTTFRSILNKISIDCKICGRKSKPEAKVGDSAVLQCSECRTRVHIECALTDQMISFAFAREAKSRLQKWQCYDCKACRLCSGKEEANNDLLLCDRCDSAEHMGCQKPPEFKVPAAPWYCSLCRQDLGIQQKKRKRTSEAKISLEKVVNENQKTEIQRPLDRFGLPSLHDNVHLTKMLNCVDSWTVDDTVSVFEHLNYFSVAEAIKREEVDGLALMLLKREDIIVKLNLKLGPALKCLRVINHIQTLAVCEKGAKLPKHLPVNVVESKATNRLT